MISKIGIFSLLFLSKTLNSAAVPQGAIDSFNTTVEILVGTQNGGDTHCGVVIYLEDSQNGQVTVPFQYNLNYGQKYTEIVPVAFEMYPENLSVSISAGGCTDSVQIEDVQVNGNKYYLSDTSYGNLDEFWVDGNNCQTDPNYPCTSPPNNYYCINGVVCGMSL